MYSGFFFDITKIITDMHFPIICLENVDTPVEDWVDCLPYDDKTLQEHTDYYGEMYNAEDRKNAIKSSWLTMFFHDFADLDVEKETVTFKDEKTCDRHRMRYYRELAEELYDKAQDNHIRWYDFYQAANEYNDNSILFYLADDGYAQASMPFVDDCIYHAGKTYRIGNIFDAHI